MSKLEKLLIELVSISYANMVFNTILAKAVVASLLSSAGSPQTYDKEIDEAYKTIDDYVNQLNEIMGGQANGR